MSFCLVISVLVLKMDKSWECFIEVQKGALCVDDIEASR